MAEPESGEVTQDFATPQWQQWTFNVSQSPLLSNFSDEFIKGNNFVKSLEWSPDGACLLSNSEDNAIRLFEYHTIASDTGSHMKASLFVNPGGAVYDMKWYPKMNSQDLSSCCFLTTSKDHPIHLWDGFSGQLRASYRYFNNLDELSSAYCITFDGQNNLYCGLTKGEIGAFDISRPGRDPVLSINNGSLSQRKKRRLQTGIISCLRFQAESTLFGAGSYDNSVAIYDSRDTSQPSFFLYPQNSNGDSEGSGVTQIEFAEGLLFSASRKSNHVLCWDLRNPSQVLHQYWRISNTNQHVLFHLSPPASSVQMLASGSQDGQVLFYDLEGHLVSQVLAHHDACGTVQFHPFMNLLATGSGERKFNFLFDDSPRTEPVSDPRVSIWSLPLQST